MKTFIVYQLIGLALEIVVAVLLRYLHAWLYKLRKKAERSEYATSPKGSEFLMVMRYIRAYLLDLVRAPYTRATQ